MNYAIHRISLDVTNDAPSQLTISAKQGDNAKRLIIALLDDKKNYQIAEGCYATFIAKKSNGKWINHPCAIENNKVIYDFQPSTVSTVGMLQCEILLFNKILFRNDKGVLVAENEDGTFTEVYENITTATFMIAVHGTIMQGIEMEAESDKLTLEEIIQRGNAFITEAERVLYKELAVEQFTATPSLLELGSKCDEVVLDWKINKKPTEQYLQDANIEPTVVNLDTNEYNMVLDCGKSPLEVTTPYVLTVKGTGKERATATACVNFYNGVYYGVDGLITPYAQNLASSTATISETSFKFKSKKEYGYQVVFTQRGDKVAFSEEYIQSLKDRGVKALKVWVDQQYYITPDTTKLPSASANYDRRGDKDTWSAVNIGLRWNSEEDYYKFRFEDDVLTPDDLSAFEITATDACSMNIYVKEYKSDYPIVSGKSYTTKQAELADGTTGTVYRVEFGVCEHGNLDMCEHEGGFMISEAYLSDLERQGYNMFTIMARSDGKIARRIGYVSTDTNFNHTMLAEEWSVITATDKNTRIFTLEEVKKLHLCTPSNDTTASYIEFYIIPSIHYNHYNVYLGTVTEIDTNGVLMFDNVDDFVVGMHVEFRNEDEPVRGARDCEVLEIDKENKTVTFNNTLLGALVDEGNEAYYVFGLEDTEDSEETEDTEDSEATEEVEDVELRMYDSDFVLGLGNHELRDSHLTDITVTAGEKQYIYYCYPSRFEKDPTFSHNSLNGGFRLVKTMKFTNSKGYEEDYNIYISDNPNLGTKTIKIR